MAARGQTRGQLSSFDRLPPEVDDLVATAAQELASMKRTQTEIYADFVTACEARMAEFRGELEFEIPAFSSFNRYSTRQAAMVRRLAMSREITSAMAKTFDGKASDDLTLMAGEAIKTLVWELLGVAGEAGLSPKDAMQLANALKSVNQAVDGKVFTEKVVEAVDNVAKAKGLSAEVAETIKAQILGVKA